MKISFDKELKKNNVVLSKETPMKNLCLLALLLPTYSMAACRISFVNEISPLADSPRIYQAIKKNFGLVKSKGFTVRSLVQGELTSHSVEIYYSDYPSKATLAMAYDHPDHSIEHVVKNRNLADSVRSLLRELPTCL
jgi:hypothetical protein